MTEPRSQVPDSPSDPPLPVEEPAPVEVLRLSENPNPIKAMRERAQISLDDLAKRAGVSKSFIVRAEQGCYTEPPGVLVDRLLDLTPVGFALGRFALHDDVYFSVRLAYARFQKATRQYNYGSLRNTFWLKYRESGYLPTDGHPLVAWRKFSGMEARITVSKYFCVHPALMFKFEVQPHLVATVPNDLVTALLDSGYGNEVLDAFENSYYTYKQYLRRRALDAQE